MEAVGTVLIFVGFAGLVIGVISVIRPIRSLHISSRGVGAAVAVAGVFLLAGGGALSPSKATSPNSGAARVASGITPVATATPAGPTATPDVAATQAAQAAAAARLEQFNTSPPDGQYSQSLAGLGRVSVAYVKYESGFSHFSAPSGYKFVTMSVYFDTSSGTFVSSNDFTLVGIAGETVSPDVSTYGFITPFPTLAVQPGNSAGGGLSFLVRADFVPSKLIWRGLSGTITVIMVLP